MRLTGCQETWPCQHLLLGHWAGGGRQNPRQGWREDWGSSRGWNRPDQKEEKDRTKQNTDCRKFMSGQSLPPPFLLSFLHITHSLTVSSGALGSLDKEAEAQGQEVTYSRSHGELLVSLGQTAQVPDFLAIPNHCRTDSKLCTSLACPGLPLSCPLPHGGHGVPVSPTRNSILFQRAQED